MRAGRPSGATERPFDVCLLGATLETGNLGVLALAASLVQNVLAVRPGARIAMLIGSRDPGWRDLPLADGVARVHVLNYRLSPRARLSEHLMWQFALALGHRLIPIPAWRRLVRRNPMLRAIHEAELVGDITGGDSFSDIYGIRSFVIGCLPTLMVRLMGRPLVLLPQTYGPFASRTARFMARRVLYGASERIARDRASGPVVESLTGGRCATRFCPDVAFTMAHRVPPSPEIHPPLGAPWPDVVGLNISGLLYRGGYTGRNMFGLKLDYADFARRLVVALLDRTDAPVLLIPHNYGPPGGANNDTEACEAVRQAVSGHPAAGRVHLLRGTYTPFEIKGIIGQCGFFVGSRMHACIGAVSRCVPTVAVAYSRKFAGVFESIGLAGMVADAGSRAADEVIEAVLAGYADRARMAAEMAEPVARARAAVGDLFRGLLCGRGGGGS